jgi:hypothetical protein
MRQCASLFGEKFDPRVLRNRRTFESPLAGNRLFRRPPTGLAGVADAFFERLGDAQRQRDRKVRRLGRPARERIRRHRAAFP